MTGRDLMAWRATRRWTQQQAADALGVSRRFYQYTEASDEPIKRSLELAIKGYAAEERQRA